MIKARLYRDFVDRRLGRNCYQEDNIKSIWELRRRIGEYRSKGIFPTFVDKQGTVLDEESAFSFLQAELETKIVKATVAILVLLALVSVCFFLK